jgi:hypothetical protein
MPPRKRKTYKGKNLGKHRDDIIDEEGLEKYGIFLDEEEFEEEYDDDNESWRDYN